LDLALAGEQAIIHNMATPERPDEHPPSGTLISLPANKSIAKHFQAGVARRGLVWPAGSKWTHWNQLKPARRTDLASAYRWRLPKQEFHFA